MTKSKEEIIEEMFEKGVLISEDFLKKEENQSSDNKFTGKIEAEEDLVVLNSDYPELIKQ